MAKDKVTRGKKRKSKGRFKGTVSRNSEKQVRGNQYSYLNLPKGVGVFKEEPGTRVSLDIMPYEVTDVNHPDRDEEYGIAVPGELWYKRPYWLHRNIGADHEAVVCPTSVKQKCPICEHRAQLLKDGVDWSDDSVKSLKPSMRNLYVVIPKGNKNYDEKPHIWDISQFLFQAKLNEEIQEDEQFETFPDLGEGHTLRIRFSEEQFGSNKFAETSRIDFVPRKTQYKESILDSIPSLDDILVIPTYGTIEALFFGGLSQSESEDEDEDEDDMEIADEDTPFEDDDDDEDEEEYDNNLEDEDEELENEEDEDEDEDEELEDEDEEETKSKKSTGGKNTTSKKNKKDTSSKTEKKDAVKGKSKKKKNKCPNGHEFGVDCDEYNECDVCDEWEACMDSSEGK